MKNPKSLLKMTAATFTLATAINLLYNDNTSITNQTQAWSKMIRTCTIVGGTIYILANISNSFHYY